MRFLRPDLLSWWLIVPVLVASWGVHARLTRAFRRRTAIARRFAPLSRRSTWRRDAAVLAVMVLVASATVFALVRPQVLVATRVPEYERQDLIVMLDRSVSMRARDLKPSRFGRATLELKTLFRQKPEGIDRVGLVGFAESPVVLSYLTSEVDSVLFYLDWLDEEPDVLFGTNLAAALTSARDVARKDDRPARKRFLLVSDGEDYGTGLDAALALFRREGHRVDCIGIGSDEAVPIPLTTSENSDSYLRDDAGRRVMTAFDEATLVRIASTTGGRYVRSTTGSDLARAISKMVTADRRILGWRSSTEYRDLYPVVLAVAAIAGAALFFLA